MAAVGPAASPVVCCVSITRSKCHQGLTVLLLPRAVPASRAVKAEDLVALESEELVETIF